MNLIKQIAAFDLFVFAVVLFVMQILAREFGYLAGRRIAAQRIGDSDSVGAVVGAMLGLLAFVLALTLSFATTRFSELRQGTLNEANAIGTAWLRAEAIGTPRGLTIAHLLEDYAHTRVEFVRSDNVPAVLEALNQRTSALQTEIWGHVASIVRERPDPVSVALQASLNDTFDMSTSLRFAYDFRLPPQLFWLLIGMALLGMAALGLQFGIKGNPTRILATLLTVLWTIVIIDILDIGAARVGAIRTSAAAYEWTIQGFGTDIVIPTLPAK